MNLRMLAAAAAAVALCACGGGGGGGETPAPGSPTGFWNGTTSTGLNAAVAVFPSGETWAAYSSNSTAGFVQGNINGAAKDFNFTSDTITDVTVSTTAQTKQSITSQVTGAQTVTFSGTYDSSFEQAPTLATVAGTYTGTGVSAGTMVTVATSGAITGTGSGCNFTGTAAPRTDGNAYNVSITFGPAPCGIPNTSMSGIAVYDQDSRGLLAATVNAPRTAAAIFLGTKP